MIIFPHGTESVGLPWIGEWRGVMERACDDAGFLGVNERAYPYHFGQLARYGTEIHALQEHHTLPPPMPVAAFERFLARAEDRYALRLAG